MKLLGITGSASRVRSAASYRPAESGTFRSTLTAMQSRLDFERHRQGVALSNIVNVETPGYIARRAERAAVPTDVMTATTDSRHLRSGAALEQLTVRDREDLPDGDDGNNVRLDVELSEMSDAALGFRSTSRGLSNIFDLYRAAASEIRP